MTRNNHNKEIWEAIDRSTILISGLLIVLLCICYFYIVESNWIEPIVKLFISNIITNIIPVFIVFIFSYYLIRKFQKLRSNVERDILLDDIEKRISEKQKPRFDGIESQLTLMTENMSNIDRRIDRVNDNIEKLWDKLPILNPESLKMVGSLLKNSFGETPKLPTIKKSSKLDRNLALLESDDDIDE